MHYAVVDGRATAQEIDEIDGQGLLVTEGTVVRVDRGRKRITIRFDRGDTETFELTDRSCCG